MKTNKQVKKINQQTDKDYDLSDFTFTFKTSPAYKKEFKEIVVKFLYKGEVITYYYFVRSEFSKKDAMNIAKRQIQSLIDDGGIDYYAKRYYKKIYKK